MQLNRSKITRVKASEEVALPNEKSVLWKMCFNEWPNTMHGAPGICWSHSLAVWGSQPQMLWLTLAQLLPSLSTSFLLPLSALCIFLRCLCFFFLMLLSLEIATFITTSFFCSFLTTTMYGWLNIISFSIWFLKSHMIWGLFSITFGVISHFGVTVLM